MADHRAEQIMDAVKTAITGLTTTGTNVVRDRTYPLGPTKKSGLSLYQGADSPASTADQSWVELDVALEFTIDIQVIIQSDTNVSQQLNLIRKEIVIALAADITQGLSFVINTIEGIAETPDIDNLTQPVAIQVYNWSVHYVRSRTDPSA